MSKPKALNRLTIERLRHTPGLQELSDEEAQKAIQSIHQLVAIICEAAAVEKSIHIDNQHVISSFQQKAAA